MKKETNIHGFSAFMLPMVTIANGFSETRLSAEASILLFACRRLWADP
jgi:hypothetical protein